MNKLKHVKEIGKTMEKDKAKKWVGEYKKKHKDATRGWLFGADVLEKILGYDGAEGIWFFKGINDEGQERLVLFPADHDGNILDKGIKSLGAKGGDDLPADDGDPCPDNCPGGL